MKTEKIKSILTHDKGNNRIYLMNLHHDDFPEIIMHLDNIALEFNYTKIFAKAAVQYAPSFLNAGYIIEAFIPKFFNGGNAVLFIAKYTSEERHIPEYEYLQEFQNMLLKPPSVSKIQLGPEYKIRKLTVTDINDMICIFKQVFETYPFPIFESAFIEKSMQEKGTRYYGVFSDGKMIAVSSAECDEVEKNAEMTDFAVLPKYRGNSLASHLLLFMENELGKDGFQTFYTISRLKSISMNKSFYNANYRYTGTLIKNTQISGTIESMNVWYKNLIK